MQPHPILDSFATWVTERSFDFLYCKASFDAINKRPFIVFIIRNKIVHFHKAAFTLEIGPITTMFADQLERFLKSEVSGARKQFIMECCIPAQRLILNGVSVQAAKRVLGKSGPCAIRGSEFSSNL